MTIAESPGGEPTPPFVSGWERLVALLRAMPARDRYFWAGLVLVAIGVSALLSPAAAAVIVGTALFSVAVFGVRSRAATPPPVVSPFAPNSGGPS